MYQHQIGASKEHKYNQRKTIAQFHPQKFAKDVENLLGKKGCKLFAKRKDQSFVRGVDQFASSMRGCQKEPGNLKEYSPWLSAFQADPFRNQLEIPGQSISSARLYDGLGIRWNFCC